MKAKWLLSKLGAEDMQPIIDALEYNGYEYKIIENEFNRYSVHLFDTDDCVVFFGPLGLGAHIQREAEWIPGVYHNIPKYRCTSYYPALSEFLLNSNYLMLPYGDMLRKKDFLYEIMGNQDTIFVRPNTGSKSFTGTIIYREHYEQDLHNLGYNALDPDSLIVVAEPQNLDGEWRFVCIGKDIITGSQYKDKLGLKVSENYPIEAFTLAKKVANAGYDPDRVYCIDIGYRPHNQDFKLIEVGCFSCAGLYACDRDIIVNRVSELALEEWKEYQQH